MAPGRTELPVHDQHQQSADDATTATTATKNKQSSSSSYPREPLQLRGVLDKFAYEEATPLLGREYPGVNIVDDLLRAPDSDALLRDVAITSAYFLFSLFSLTLSLTLSPTHTLRGN